MEPFERNYSEHLYTYWIICVFHATVVSICYLIIFLILHQIHQPNIWQLKHELTFSLALFSLIGLGAFLIRDLIYDADNWRLEILIEEIVHGYIAGTIYYFGIFQINRQFMVVQQNKDIESIQNSTSIIALKAAIPSDNFEFDLHHLVYIKAEGNYTEFYIWQNDQLDKLIKRMTLQNAWDQLTFHHHLVKTHRSYIVNTDYILKVSGNAQGYTLHLTDQATEVPLSRANFEIFRLRTGLI